VVAGAHHEADAERSRVQLVGAPRPVEDGVDRVAHVFVECQARPLVEDRQRVVRRRPGEPAERVEVGLRERVPGPERVVAHIGHRHDLVDTGDELVPEYFAPLWTEVARVPLLAGVLLRHLQLDRHAGVRHRGDDR
jgi:hypothetical protein